jgi:high-affinity nickel-transport protein
MLHGIGAETPTQLGLFLFAAGVGGRLVGVAGLALFVAGLLVTNAAMCFAATRTLTLRNPKWQRTLAGLSAAYSLCVGVTFLFA